MRKHGPVTARRTEYAGNPLSVCRSFADRLAAIPEAKGFFARAADDTLYLLAIMDSDAVEPEYAVYEAYGAMVAELGFPKTDLMLANLRHFTWLEILAGVPPDSLYVALTQTWREIQQVVRP